MKKMKWAVLFAALVSAFGFSSCLDSEEGESYDLFDYVTVTDGFMGSTALKGDNSGMTFTPVSSDVLASLQMKDGGYYKRAMVGIQLAEEYSPGKSNYQISGIQVYNYLPYKTFTTQPDTISGDFNFLDLGKGNEKPWVRTGFVNVVFSVNLVNSSTLNDFNMHITEVSNDTLYAKLQYSKDNTSINNPLKDLFSFELPDYIPNSGQLSDSIVLTVVAQCNDEVKKVSTDKFHRKELY